MKLMNLFGSCCISTTSTAIGLPLEKQYPQRKHGKHISEHTTLLNVQRDAVLESGVSTLEVKDAHHGRIEEKISALSKKPKVVVLRVSLHCQGCAKKVRRHISKMEGVTTVAIDLEKKKVTVMGNISPIGVLESISKVKNAELWASPMQV